MLLYIYNNVLCIPCNIIYIYISYIYCTAGAAAAGRTHRVAHRHRRCRRDGSPAAPGPVQAVRVHLRVPVSGDA